jgi:urease gamma subunit
MFGEWHTEEKEKAIKEFKEYKEQKTRVAMEYVITNTELPFPKSKKRKTKEISGNKLTKVSKVAETVIETTNDQEVNDEIYQFLANQIEVGDIVVVVCSMIDKWSIPVPNTSKHVWVCSVLDMKIVARRARVVGQFFKGNIDELLFDHNSQQVVDVRDDDIANMLSGIQQVAWFQFEDDEITQIINFCKAI